MPSCARCTASGIECIFMKSRRGFQGRKKKRLYPDSVNELDTPVDDAGFANSVDTDPVFSTPSFAIPEGQEALSEETTSTPHIDVEDPDFDKLINVYYRDIHPAHPIVLPQRLYLQNRNILPEYLRAVMAFMASHLSSVVSDKLQQQAERVFDPNIPDNGFKVQALLLLTLTSYARFERDRGNKALTEATSLASRIGLDCNGFGQGQGLIYRESWRRTYWELYTITGLISLIAGMNFRIRRPDDLLLPGHCEDYKSGRFGESRDLRAMRQRVPMEDKFKWSSFAYKIEAMRIMSSIFEGEKSDGSLSDAQVQAMGASLTGFLFSLPAEKRNPVQDDGDIDEVMSCALMIINLAGICLHFPRSSLAGKVSFKTVCGNDRRDKLESQDERFHRAAAIRSANGISKLIASRQSLKTLTPCFSCSIAFAAAVHLAAILPRDNSEAQHKEHIQLELSALNIVGGIWPIGGVVKSQLAQYTREVLSYRPAPAVLPSSSDHILSALPLQGEPWLDDLTSQYIDIPSEGFLFDLMSQPVDSTNRTT